MIARGWSVICNGIWAESAREPGARSIAGLHAPRVTALGHERQRPGHVAKEVGEGLARFGILHETTLRIPRRKNGKIENLWAKLKGD